MKRILSKIVFIILALCLISTIIKVAYSEPSTFLQTKTAALANELKNITNRLAYKENAPNTKFSFIKTDIKSNLINDLTLLHSELENNGSEEFSSLEQKQLLAIVNKLIDYCSTVPDVSKKLLDENNSSYEPLSQDTTEERQKQPQHESSPKEPNKKIDFFSHFIFPLTYLYQRALFIKDTTLKNSVITIMVRLFSIIGIDSELLHNPYNIIARPSETLPNQLDTITHTEPTNISTDITIQNPDDAAKNNSNEIIIPEAPPPPPVNDSGTGKPIDLSKIKSSTPPSSSKNQDLLDEIRANKPLKPIDGKKISPRPSPKPSAQEVKETLERLKSAKDRILKPKPDTSNPLKPITEDTEAKKQGLEGFGKIISDTIDRKKELIAEKIKEQEAIKAAKETDEEDSDWE